MHIFYQPCIHKYIILAWHPLTYYSSRYITAIGIYESFNNNNNNNMFNLQVANSLSGVMFEANLPGERSELYRAHSKPDESN